MCVQVSGVFVDYCRVNLQYIILFGELNMLVTFGLRGPKFKRNYNDHHIKGDGAYAVPTIKNYASELSALGIIAGVNPTVVQWRGLALGEPPK
ncbi:hypothetical protein RR46_01567 [Papilio xuthus]|uniref:Uncharacterized protein n=1 Tax=Papilio xuthus TaxID=66420 RepID=A0A0N0P9Y6_PAPXU|nr:hypothetical protein RR46_01567 [Papilio xuthus]